MSKLPKLPSLDGKYVELVRQGGTQRVLTGRTGCPVLFDKPGPNLVAAALHCYYTFGIHWDGRVFLQLCEGVRQHSLRAQFREYIKSSKSRIRLDKRTLAKQERKLQAFIRKWGNV